MYCALAAGALIRIIRFDGHHNRNILSYLYSIIYNRYDVAIIYGMKKLCGFILYPTCIQQTIYILNQTCRPEAFWSRDMKMLNARLPLAELQSKTLSVFFLSKHKAINCFVHNNFRAIHALKHDDQFRERNKKNSDEVQLQGLLNFISLALLAQWLCYSSYNKMLLCYLYL